jgi:hypothetical protein
MRRAAIAVLILAATLLAPASVAFGQTSPTVGVDDGTLVGEGAAVSLPVTYVCENALEGILSVTVTQRGHGGRIAQGSSHPPLDPATCTGNPVTIDLLIPALVGGSAFKPGEALAHAMLSVCDATTFNCTLRDVSEVIRLRR